MKRDLLRVGALTALVQLIAFGKLWLTARLFGVGVIMDGYNLAFVIPTLVSGTFAGVVQTGLFPIRAQIATRKGWAEHLSLFAFERSILLITAALALFTAGLLLMAAPLVSALSSSQAPILVQETSRFVLPFAIATMALHLMIDTSGYILAMRDRFWIAAGAPIANGLFGATLLLAWPQGGLINLVLGTLIGAILQMLLCFAGLRSVGLSVRGALWPMAAIRRAIAQMGSLGAWILPGVVFSNLIVALPPIWISAYSVGAVSAYGYAYRLHSATLQLLILTGSTVVLAHFANMVVQRDRSGILRVLFVFAAFATGAGLLGLACLAIVGEPFLELLFGSSIRTEEVQLLLQNWWWLTLGLPFAVFGTVLAKLWQAQARPYLLSCASGFALACAWGFHTVFLDGRTPLAASIATTVASLAIMLFALLVLALRTPLFKGSDA